MILAPVLTEYDPVTDSEGPLDPLGLYGIANSLGVKLVPGVRERQSNPRFLTAMAVGAIVNSRFDSEALESLPENQPWLVYEWHLVEGLVRRYRDGEQVLRLPGRFKALRAIDQGAHLGRNNYLKAPRVFGFHGIYRLLAHTLNVLDDSPDPLLGELGCELAMAWEQDQGLEGFSNSDRGTGADRRKQITEAVRVGLKAGAVHRTPAWNGWSFFADHLAPHRFGQRERKIIRAALLSDDSQLRRETLGFLISPEGQACWLKGDGSERAFHLELRKRASAELGPILDAILAYERFSRLAQDAFDDCLRFMTVAQGKVSPLEMAELDCVKRAAAEIPSTFAEVEDRLSEVELASRFAESFGSLAEPGQGSDWVDRLLEHHRGTQQAKPPHGRMPWFERFESGGTIIRPGYRRDEGGRGDGSYANMYRANPLWSFARELGWVQE